MDKLFFITVLSMLLAVSACAADISQQVTDYSVPVWDADEYQVLSELWDEVDVYWHEGDYDKCIDSLKKIIDYDPKQVEAYTNAAWLLDSTNRLFESVDMQVRCVIANPRNSDSHFELAMRYYYLGNYDDTVRKLETAYFYEESTLTLRMLAHAYELAGDRDKAIKCYAATLGRNPNDGAALMNLTRILNRVPPANDPTRLWHRPDPEDM